MDYTALKTQDFQRIAEEIHKRFVDSMYPYFNCPRHPEYFDVEVQPIFAYSGFAVHCSDYKNGGAIIISDPAKEKCLDGRVKNKIPTREDYEDFVLNCVHETAHLLHPWCWRFNKEVYLGLREDKKTQKEINFIEFFADYVSLFFFKNYQPELFRASRRAIASFPLLKCYEKGSEFWKATLRHIARNFTVRIFNRAPDLLPELAMQKPDGIARFLLRRI